MKYLMYECLRNVSTPTLVPLKLQWNVHKLVKLDFSSMSNALRTKCGQGRRRSFFTAIGRSIPSVETRVVLKSRISLSLPFPRWLRRKLCVHPRYTCRTMLKVWLTCILRFGSCCPHQMSFCKTVVDLLLQLHLPHCRIGRQRILIGNSIFSVLPLATWSYYEPRKIGVFRSEV